MIPLFFGLSLLFLPLAYLDLRSTRKGLAMGGREVNPLMRNIITNHRRLPALVKYGMVLAMLAFFGLARQDPASPPPGVSYYLELSVGIAMLLVQAFIVVRNYWQIWGAEKNETA